MQAGETEASETQKSQVKGGKQVKLRPLTLKEKKTAKGMLEGKSAQKAMLEAGYSPASAKNSHTVTKKPSFVAALEKAGVTDDKLSQVISDGLQAEKVYVVGSGDDAMAEITPDHAVRHKFLETAIKVKSLIPKDDASPTLNVQFNNVVNQDVDDFNL